MFLKMVNKGLEGRLYPSEEMVHKLNQNIDNARFTWNQLLNEYQKTYTLFKQHGYTHLNCNMTTFNTILKMLKKEYYFLCLSESSRLQQVFRDLINGFKKFIQISRWFPSGKNCHNCGYYNNLKREEREWICPNCGEHNDRDINAAKNILFKGLRIYHKCLVNFRDWEDSTVILEALASTAREVRILEFHSSR